MSARERSIEIKLWVEMEIERMMLVLLGASGCCTHWGWEEGGKIDLSEERTEGSGPKRSMATIMIW